MNNQTFVGNLTADPVLRDSASGVLRATMSVAINEGDKEKGNEKAHFINVTAFGTLGENVAASLKKGMRVVISARLDTRQIDADIDSVSNGETVKKSVKLTQTSFIASAIGPDLRWARAAVSRVVKDREDGHFAGDEDPAAEVAPEPAKAAAKPAAARKPAAAAAPVEDVF